MEDNISIQDSNEKIEEITKLIGHLAYPKYLSIFLY